MAEMSTAQIAAQVGTSERTVRRWIEQGKLQAQPTQHRGYYLVNPADLEQLIHHDADEFSRLREEVADLRRRVEALEQQSPRARSVPTRRTDFATSRPAREEGMVSARQFYEDHKVSKDWLSGQLRRKEIEATPVGRVNMLTREQQAAVIAFWDESSFEYQPCLHCPHRTN